MDKTYLLDTSAWLEYIGGTGSETHLFVKELRDTRQEVATTDPVMCELLSGARSENAFFRLDAMLQAQSRLTVEPTFDFREAAIIYRTARSKGKTIRKHMDCLIAAVALRTDAVLVHCDRDFDHLAEVFPRLRVQRHNQA
ncbi:PIN domain nuclease [Nocardiopsis sp. LOL_012]|uniref:type II toxin-antitoxin system VapC family toxin n=1 Tax=Nocardiopsis sp. LOL_012 TaxID=3345409 RepID=UPI003A892209